MSDDGHHPGTAVTHCEMFGHILNPHLSARNVLLDGVGGERGERGERGMRGGGGLASLPGPFGRWEVGGGGGGR